MKTLIFLISILISFNAFADFILSPGVTLSSPFKSYEEDSTAKAILDADAGAGLLLNLDWIVFGPLTLGVGVGYQARSARVQYKNDIATANDLDVSMIGINAEVGTKIRIINFKRFKTFIGGGLTVGSKILTYDENDFEFKTGSRNGFVESESKSYNGIYLDAGFEYILSNKSGIRLSGKYTELETAKFDNLNNESLTIDSLAYSIQYMHYVNWDFFWK